MRDVRIDFLRFVGLAMIILAHVYPPPWLMQLRNFDVPLMVLLSGLSFRASLKAEPYHQYVWTRFKRLVLPVWIFLSFLFALEALTRFPSYLPSVEKIWRSYALLDGIGFVWVIRVFLLVALMAPFIYWFSCKVQSHRQYFLALAAVYLGFETLLWFAPAAQVGYLITNTLYYCLPYGVVFAIGLRMPDLSTRAVVWLTGLMGALLLAWVGWYFISQGNWQPTQKFKYPPQSYYMAYALLISGLLYLVGHSVMRGLTRLKVSGFVLFVGSNSIWIYLWHILFIQWLSAWDYPQEYLAVFAGATLVTWMQVKLVQKFLDRLTSVTAKRNVKMLLTG